MKILLNTLVFMMPVFFLIIATQPLSSYAKGNQITDSSRPVNCLWEQNGMTQKRKCRELNSNAKKVVINDVCIFTDSVPSNTGWHQGRWDGRKSGTTRFTSKRACSKGVEMYNKDAGMDLRIGPRISEATRKKDVNKNKWTVADSAATDAFKVAQDEFNKKQKANEEPTEALFPHFCFKNESRGIPSSMVECIGYNGSMKGFCFKKLLDVSSKPNKGVVGEWWVITTNAKGGYAICKGGVELVPASEQSSDFKALGDTSYTTIDDGGQPPKRCLIDDTKSYRCNQHACRFKDGAVIEEGLPFDAAQCADDIADACEAKACSGCRYDSKKTGSKCRCNKIGITPNFKTGCCWDATWTGSPGNWVRYSGSTPVPCAKGILLEPLE
jgi:hypothetical protein